MLNSLLALQSSRGRHGPPRLSHGSEGLRGATPSCPPRALQALLRGAPSSSGATALLHASRFPVSEGSSGEKKPLTNRFYGWLPEGTESKTRHLPGVTQQIRPELGRQPKSPRSHLPCFTLQGKKQTLPAHGCGWCLALLHGGCRGPGRLLPKSVKVSHAWS